MRQTDTPFKIFTALLFFTASYCASGEEQKIYHKPDSEGGQAIEKLNRAEREFQVISKKEQYVATAKKFISSAQIGDFSSMVKLTSELTVRETGETRLATIYKDQVIPAFTNTTVDWSDEIRVIADDTGNFGAVVSGRVKGSNEFLVYVTVLFEKTQFVVITMNRKKVPVKESK